VVQRVAVRVTFPDEVQKAVTLRPGLSVVATVHTRDPDAPKPTLLGALGLEALGAKSEKP
jgi:multidrug resistance efflux pump